MPDRPADPVVSPADTPDRIEQLREKAERHGRDDGDETYSESPGWNDVLFLLAVRERDRQQIARLTEALAEIAEGYDGIEFADSADTCEEHIDIARAALRAVLAGEEDAA